MAGTRCSCGEGHVTFGACMRAKNLRVAYCQSWRGHDATAEKHKNKELDLYASARKQGIQPVTTKTADIQAAVEISNHQGRAFDGAKGPVMLDD